MSGFPLPAAVTLWANHPRSEDIKNTYRIVLEAEQAALSKLEGHSLSKERTSHHTLNVICARLVGYLMLEPLNGIAQTYVLKEVKSCHQLHGYSEDALNAAIYELGLFYVNHYIRPFKKYKGRTPAPSGHASQPSFGRRQEYAQELLKGTPANHAESKHAGLIRDDHRCMVCHKYDLNSVVSIEELKTEARATNAELCSTQCCYIISESINMDLSCDKKVCHFVAASDQLEHAATVWTILANFGEPTLLDELNGLNVHRLDNILTLEATIRDSFDNLRIWFDKVNPLDMNDHHYYLRTSLDEDVFALTRYPSEVRFVNHAPDAGKSPLPNPRYLRIHAACARVAHLSGAAEYIDKVFRDIEDEHVLANDGSSVDILTNALLHMTRIGVFTDT